MLRLGRISYANMAPVFYDLEEGAFEQVPGVPTELNRRLMDGDIDVAPISSIEYARNADRLRLLPQLCVSTEGAVDSIQLITRKPLEQVRSVAVTPESATSVVLTKVLLGDVDLVPLEQPADARMLIGDAALRSAFEDPTPHHDLGRLWQERTGLPMVYAVWACRDGITDGLEELQRAHLRSLAIARSEPEALARRASADYGWPAGFLARYFEKLRYHFGPREQQGLVRFFELAHLAGELERVPPLRFAELSPAIAG
jgi:chorismate dehydratase